MKPTLRSRASVSLPLGWLGAALFASLALVVFLVLRGGAESYAVVGLPDPGAVTRVGTYVLRFSVDLGSAVCVGGLLYAAFFTASEPAGRLSADGWAAMRLGGRAAWMWFGSALVLIPFEAADSNGMGVGSVLTPAELIGAFSALYGPPAWLVSALLALTVAMSCHLVLTWRATVALAALAVLGVLPPVAVGNASSGTAHDYTMNVLAYHVIVAAAWLGVLAALVLHLRRGTGRVDLALRRYRPFAVGCWLLLAPTGLFAALLVASPEQLVTTEYGWMMLAKLVGLLVVGVLVTEIRRRLARTPDLPRVALRLAAAEIMLILVTVAVTMGMTQAPPPSWLGPPLSAVEIALGYALPGPPTVLSLLTVWRFDLLIGFPAVVAGAGYVLGARRLRRRGERWPVVRTAAWLGGCGLVVVATSSGLGAYMPASFGVHMASHMVLTMFAPLLLVLGGPVTLALHVLRPATTGAAPGPREWLTALVSSPLARLLSRPGLAATLFVASSYLLYLTPLFETALSEHWSRTSLNVVLFAIGYLFFWGIVGVDPSPRHLPHLGRLGMVFAVMPFHAVFAAIVLTMNTPIAGLYYRTLDLPWFTDLLANQRLGAVVSLVAGELALVAAQIVLLVQWNRHDHADGTPGNALDEDAVAYRAMLDKLKQDRGGAGAVRGVG